MPQKKHPFALCIDLFARKFLQNFVCHIGVVTHNRVRADRCEMPHIVCIVNRPILHGNIVFVRIIRNACGAEIEHEIVIRDLQRLEFVIPLCVVNTEQAREIEVYNSLMPAERSISG